MPPELTLALGLIQLAKQAIPVVEDLFKKGQITKEHQQKVLDDYNALKAAGDAAFTGDEWTIDPD